MIQAGALTRNELRISGMTEPCLTSLEQQEAAWIASMDSSVGALSTRAKRALFLQGVKTKNEALRIYCVFFTMPNCGRKTQIEIGEWIGLTEPEERDFARAMSQKLIDQYYKERELSHRKMQNAMFDLLISRL